MHINHYPEKKMWHCRNRIAVGIFNFVPELFLYKGKSDVYKAVVIWGDLEWTRNFKGRGLGHESISAIMLWQFQRFGEDALRLHKWNEVGKVRLPA